MEEKQVNIPDGWVEIGQLANLSKVYNGLSGKKKDDFGEGEPYIPYVNVFKNSKIDPSELDYVKVKFGERQNAVEYGDIIFTTSSETIEEVGMASIFVESSGKYYLNSFCFILRLNNKDWLLPQFAQYLFRSENVRYSISLLGQGSTRYNLSKTRLLKELKFIIPSDTREQTTIARILSKVDEAIAQTEQLIAKYTRIKTGLMQDLLTKGIDEHGNIRNEETHEFKDSLLGRIPVEWEVKKLSDFCLKIVDCPHSTPTYLNDGVLVARTQNIKNGKYLTESSSCVSEEEFNERILRLEPKYDDIIFTREAPIGEAFVIPKGMRICLGQRVMLFRLDKSIMLSDFLVELIYSEETKIVFDAITGGTTVSHLNVKDVKDLNFIVPSTSEQNLILRQLTKSKSLIISFENQLSKLQSLKTGLMQDLLSGKVRVKVSEL
jgi:type I restriction enzyme S subunit